jgi:DNA-directed RNA polymerase specialized sigma24 family protein
VLNNVLRHTLRKSAAARRWHADDCSVESIAESHRNPEEAYSDREQRLAARRLMMGLNPMEREILRRFYLEDESSDEIQRALGLTPTQFRLKKSIAKARLTAAISATRQRGRQLERKARSDRPSVGMNSCRWASDRASVFIAVAAGSSSEMGQRAS